MVKAGQNIAQLQQELASVSKIDIDFNISLLPEQIAAESVSEPNRGSDYVYDTFKANANSYLIQKVTYQLSNTNFLNFLTMIHNCLTFWMRLNHLYIPPILACI